MQQLKRAFPGVERGGTVWYGGSQNWSENRRLRRSGCGAAAGLDLVRYLSQKEKAAGSADAPAGIISGEEWTESFCAYAKKYFPVIPRFGMTGLGLAFGLNRLFRKEGLPYRARWRFSGKRFFGRLEEQLSRDIPVIMAVGPNFPCFWQKNRLAFYMRSGDGSLVRRSGAKGHFVTVTEADAETLTISSWGKKYIVLRSELVEYVKRHGTWLTTNMMSVTERKKT